MSRIGRSRIHHYYFPLLLPQLQAGVSWLYVVWHTRFPVLSVFSLFDVELGAATAVKFVDQQP